MHKEKIYKLAIVSGFKLKQVDDDTMDIDPCVYTFADKLLAQHDMMGLDLIQQIRQAAGDAHGKLMHDELVAHIAELKVIEKRRDETADKLLERCICMRRALELSRKILVDFGAKSSHTFVIEEIDKALASASERN